VLLEIDSSTFSVQIENMLGNIQSDQFLLIDFVPQ